MIASAEIYVPSPQMPTWYAPHTPAVSVVASAVQPAPGSGRRLVVTGFSATIGAGATAPAATVATITLSSGGAVLWAAKLGAQATAASISGIVRSGRWRGGENQPVKLEFSGTATNVEQSVSMEGYEEVLP